MPALPNIPNVIKAQVHYQVGSDTTAMTVHHFRYSGTPPDSSSCLLLAQEILSKAVPLAAHMDTSSGLTAVTVTDLSTNLGGQNTFTGTTMGTASGGTLSAGTAFLCNLQIARRYRGGKPRNYFPFGTTLNLSGRTQWIGAFHDSVQTDLVAFFNSCVGLSGGGTSLIAHCSVGYHDKNAPGGILSSPHVDTITGYKCSMHVASQRRRNQT